MQVKMKDDVTFKVFTKSEMLKLVKDIEILNESNAKLKTAVDNTAKSMEELIKLVDKLMGDLNKELDRSLKENIAGAGDSANFSDVDEKAKAGGKAAVFKNTVEAFQKGINRFNTNFISVTHEIVNLNFKAVDSVVALIKPFTSSI